MFNQLKKIVEDTGSPAGKIFDIGIQILIAISVITFSISTLPNLSPNQKALLSYTDLALISIFSFEYVLRFLVATKKVNYVFSFFGIIDLLSILPSILMLGIDLRALRALRFLRLIRILKLARYSKAMLRLKTALSEIKEELILFLVLTITLIYFAAVGIYYFENPVQPEVFKSVFHSLWWAVATLTTVGYGDAYPITAGGRLFTFVILMIGLGIVAIPAGLFASALTKPEDK